METSPGEVMPRGQFTPFTEEQELQIKTEYLDKPVKRLARELGTGNGRIMRFLKKNDLEIPKELIEQRKKDSQLKKGRVPYTKGLKQCEFMTAEAIERTKKTRFKKGNIPHNTKKDGAIAIRKDKNGYSYKRIRISLNNWKTLHRVIWEEANGPIPDDHIIIFIDQNSMNVQLSNLCIRSKVEHVLRNSPIDFPEEVIPSMVLMNQLKSKLKEIEDAA